MSRHGRILLWMVLWTGWRDSHGRRRPTSLELVREQLVLLLCKKGEKQRRKRREERRKSSLCVLLLRILGRGALGLLLLFSLASHFSYQSLRLTQELPISTLRYCPNCQLGHQERGGKRTIFITPKSKHKLMARLRILLDFKPLLHPISPSPFLPFPSLQKTHLLHS